MATYFNQRILRDMLHRQILPWARADRMPLAVVAPERVAPPAIKVAPHHVEPRSQTRNQNIPQRDAPWAEMGLHCRPNPLILFVLDGEADFRIGTVLDSQSQSYEVSVYTLPAQSCLIVPPYVGHADGSTPHWERPHPEKAYSRILWLQILATGAIIHVCQTQDGKHSHTSSLFVRDAQLSPLTHFLIERASKYAHGDPVVSSFLQTLLMCVEQGKVSGGPPDNDVVENSAALPRTPEQPSYVFNDFHQEAFERACQYIRSHLTDALTPDSVARHACISVSQLKRIFRAHLGTSVMKYVAQRRLEEAQDLLLQTRLTTQQIGETCGYPHRAHFSRAFKESTGTSPLMFRRQAAQRSARQNS